MGSSQCTKITPDVPRDTKPNPSCITPAPIAEAALSPPPATTGAPLGIPDSFATSAVM
jgi:hypothetical protein